MDIWTADVKLMFSWFATLISYDYGFCCKIITHELMDKQTNKQMNRHTQLVLYNINKYNEYLLNEKFPELDFVLFLMMH